MNNLRVSLQFISMIYSNTNKPIENISQQFKKILNFKAANENSIDCFKLNR